MQPFAKQSGVKHYIFISEALHLGSSLVPPAGSTPLLLLHHHSLYYMNTYCMYILYLLYEILSW